MDEQPQTEHHEHVHQGDHVHDGAKTGIMGKLSKYRGAIIATFAYLVIALVVFYPITLHMGAYVPGGNGGDTYQNLWFLWWARYAVLNLHTNVFQTSVLYWPVGANLVYQTMAPLLGLLSAPFQVFGVPFAYDVVYLVGFALSGFGMYLLADYLVKDGKAAFVSGIIFAFSAFHIAQSVHIHFINIEWAPLFAYFLLRMINEKDDYWNVAGMAGTFALSTLASNIEVSLIIIWILPLVVAYYLAAKERRSKVLCRWFAVALALFFVGAFVAGSWNYVPILKTLVHDAGVGTADYLNTPMYNALWSDNLFAFFLPSYYNGIAYSAGLSKALYGTIYLGNPTEREAYIGYSVLVLALYGLYKNRKDAMLWLVGAIIFGLLCLGPLVQIGSYLSNFQDGLYSLYRIIPFISIVREPGRFQLLFTMCVAVMAAFGFKELDRKINETRAKGAWRPYAVTAIASVIILAELAAIPMSASLINQMSTNLRIPTIYGELGSLRANFSVLELPATTVGTSTPALYTGTAMYYTSIDKKPLIGGDLGGRENATDDELLYSIPLVIEDSNLLNYGAFAYLSPVSQNYTNQTLLSLYNYQAGMVVLQKGAYNESELYQEASYLYSVFGPPVYNDNATIAFSTANALSRPLYRSFVAYPAIEEWNSSNATVNGSTRILWSPAYQGAMVVYAPYQNATGSAAGIAESYVRTRISFGAVSLTPQEFMVAEPVQGGRYQVLGQVNLTSRYVEYAINTTLVSGSAGNPLMFLPQYSNKRVYLWNLTFSKN